MVHRINIFLLSIILVVAQVTTMNQALAAGLNGWSLQNPIVKGASVAYEGVKNVIINGKNVAKTSTALITPTAAQVSKTVIKIGGGYALIFAVEQLLGKVDWVLDPENNQIKYKEKKENNCQYLYNYNGKNYCFEDLQAAANKYYADMGIKNANCTPIKVNPSPNASANIECAGLGGTVGSASASLNPNYDPDAVEEEKTIPLDVVSQKIIDNANGGDTTAQGTTSTAAADIVAEAETDNTKARPIVNQLEANAKTETDADANTATGETKPNTETGGTDLALEFPTFCGWAPQVCEAAQTVISFPTTLADWWNTGKSKAESWAQSISQAWTATKEWMNKEDTPEQTTEVDIDQTVPVVPNTSYFSWGAYCPFTPGSQTISLDNTSVGLDYDLTSWCELASELRPFVLAAGALMSFLIASGVIMGRDD